MTELNELRAAVDRLAARGDALGRIHTRLEGTAEHREPPAPERA